MTQFLVLRAVLGARWLSRSFIGKEHTTMELFDLHEYAIARQQDALRSFRAAERLGLTRERASERNAPATPAPAPKHVRPGREWNAGAE